MQAIEVVSKRKLLEVGPSIEHVSATDPNAFIVDLVRLLYNSVQLGRLVPDVLAAFAPTYHFCIECLSLILGLLYEKLFVGDIAVAYFHSALVQRAPLREVYYVELDRA